ncbi:helix-turn-helix domain-containing protein [Streptomyces sp. NBC_01216]|uniref:helix-turn-helix domain-containing protein n=1 Tax=unclassified Streptomyces TaxID=2593676 RepID=UPI002E0F2F8E|nr:helix-turn-helix domain-containing protein [Streptomyces sp. NBC_01216]
MTGVERQRLKKMAYGHKSEYRMRLRAQVVPHAARGRSNATIARETGLHLDTVRTWRGRFAGQRLAGLADRTRPGRPRAFTALQTAQVKALACRPYAVTRRGRPRWRGMNNTARRMFATLAITGAALGMTGVAHADDAPPATPGSGILGLGDTGGQNWDASTNQNVFAAGDSLMSGMDNAFAPGSPIGGISGVGASHVR